MKQFDERDIWDVPQLSFTEWLFRTTGARWPFLLALGLAFAAIPGCVL